MLRRIVIVLVVLAGLSALADRGTASLAGNTVAAAIQKSEKLKEKPSVGFGGFPFITQAVGGKYKRVDIDIRDYTKAGIRIHRITVDLEGVHLSLGDAIGGKADRIPVDHGKGRLEFAYADINEYLSHRSGDLHVKSGGPGKLLVTTVASVAGLGGVPVEGDATVKVVANGLHVDVTNVRPSSGGALSSAVRDAAAGKMAFDIPATGLPFGIALKNVEVDTESVAVSATADHFVIQKF